MFNLRLPFSSNGVRAETDKLLQRLEELQEALRLSHKECDTQKLVAVSLGSKLEANHKELEDVKTALKRSQDEAELTLLQLQQVQEELERYFLTSLKQEDLAVQLQTKDQILKTAEARAADITKQHLKCSQELEIVNKRMKETQEEAELTLLQLNQVQEELEHYFLRSRAGDELTQAHTHEQARAMNLLGRMIRLQATDL